MVLLSTRSCSRKEDCNRGLGEQQAAKRLNLKFSIGVKAPPRLYLEPFPWSSPGFASPDVSPSYDAVESGIFLIKSTHGSNEGSGSFSIEAGLLQLDCAGTDERIRNNRTTGRQLWLHWAWADGYVTMNTQHARERD